MKFKNFKIQILIRILAVTTGISFFLYYLFIEFNYIRLFFIGLLILLILFNLFHYINKTNKDIRLFILSILSDDFTTHFAQNEKGSSYKALYSSFNAVNAKLKSLKADREAQFSFLSTLIDQIGIAIISIDSDGMVHLVNNAFEKLFKVDHLVNINEIRNQNQEVYQSLQQINPGNSMIVKIEISGKMNHLSISSTGFRLKGHDYKLVTIQDVKNQLDENEMLAWQKLIRVLTHEIMNSVAPITSLSASLRQLVESMSLGQFENDKMEKLVMGLEAIESRSSGLMGFTKAYRRLTRIPVPQLQNIEIESFFREQLQVIKATLVHASIEFKNNLPDPHATFKIDPSLMQQVLINLVKNAEDAILHNNIREGKILISTDALDRDQIEINIEDNGGGISSTIQDQLFIPFFTTRESGSGIGLSLCKQIIALHGGKIDFTSSQEKKSSNFQIII